MKCTSCYKYPFCDRYVDPKRTDCSEFKSKRMMLEEVEKVDCDNEELEATKNALLGKKVKLKGLNRLARIVNVNDFREPDKRYGADLEGFPDVVFFGDDSIEEVIE